ncbi:DEAD/DEAH box helicase [Streptomyces sp. 796.1]|uniref:DEAD/DEAH box helicase n=1 Tax=Streptomyces sp. 796.1 TaxID=3163029 RepID=UPI0039C946F5
MLRGLFIGVDNYESPSFRQLNYAKQDARVLRALFLDNFDGNASLVLDDAATKDRLLTELGQLAVESTSDDVVVISFSGHGTRTHELATWDAHPDDLATTALGLEDLVDRIGVIRASVLLVVLDCCFAGAAFTKVLRQPEGAASRGPGHAAAHVLNRVSGKGRVILAASAADQQAYERPELRHGVLTYYLIQALLGHRDVVVDDGRIPLLRLADYVSRKTGGHDLRPWEVPQNPSMGGYIDNAMFSTFRRGENLAAVGGHPEPLRATHAFGSLLELGIPAAAIRLWNQEFDGLNGLQVEAVNEGGLFAGSNVVVSAPTASGKTLIGELAALHAFARNVRTVFLLPTRALVNEQFERFTARYGPGGVVTIRVTSDLRDHMSDLLVGKFDLALLTYEKFIGLLFTSPGLLERIGVLVVDEIQALLTPDRGPLLEMLFTWLKMRRGHSAVPQVIGLSAVLKDAEEVALWLGAQLVSSVDRAVPLHEGVVDLKGTYRYCDQKGAEAEEQLVQPMVDVFPDEDGQEALALHVVQGLVSMGHQVLVFRNTRQRALDLARNLTHLLGLPAASAAQELVSQGEGGRAADGLYCCLSGGVAFHTSDLSDAQRRTVEESFRSTDRDIRVVVATTTLAQGVNLPADSVVIGELLHPDEEGRKYLVSEYKNMAGRAGRAGAARPGRAVILTRGELDGERLWGTYVKGAPEGQPAALLTPSVDLRSVVLAALAGPTDDMGRPTEVDVEKFLAWTFASHQCRVSGQPAPFPPNLVRRATGDLIGAGLLRGTDASYVVTELGEIAVRTRLGVDSVIELAEVMRTVPADSINRMTLICAAQLVRELDDKRFVRFHQQMRREHHALLAELTGQKVAEPVLNRLMGAGDKKGIGVAGARRAIACLLWAQGVPMAQIERRLTRYLRNPSPMPVEPLAQLTADVMGAVIDIVHSVHPRADLGSLAESLAAELEWGVGAGLTPVAQHMEVRLGREVYRRLAGQGLDTAEAIARADDDRLFGCVGGATELALALRAAATAVQEEAQRIDDVNPLLPPVD